MNISEIIKIVIQQCGNPDQHRPGEDAIMLAIRKQAQTLHNDMQAALPGWDLNYKDVQVMPGNSLKPTPLEIPSLGKVRRVYAMEQGDNTISRTLPVQLCDVDELGLYQGQAYSATAAAPFHRDGRIFIQFAPEVISSLQYRVWYEVGAIENLAKESTVLQQVDSYHFLLADMVTIDILPRCWWSWLLGKEVEMKMADQMRLMKMHRDELIKPINQSIQTQWPMWKQHISGIWESQEPFPNGYADWAEFDVNLFL